MNTADDLRAKLLALEEKLLSPKVRKSVDQLTIYLADDFVEFGASGRSMDRQRIIESLMGSKTDYRYTVSEFILRRLCDDAALVTYRLSAHSESGSDTMRSLRCSVWVHRERRWQMVFHQGTRAEK